MRVVNSRAAAGHFDMPPAFERRKEHEEIGGAGFNTSDISDVSWTFVFVIGSRETSRFHRDRLPRIGNQLLRGFIKTDQRNIAIARAPCSPATAASSLSVLQAAVSRPMRSVWLPSRRRKCVASAALPSACGSKLHQALPRSIDDEPART